MSAVAPLSVLDQACSAITKRAREPAATEKFPRTRKNFPPGRGKIKLMVSLASYSSAKSASSSKNRSPSVGCT